MDMTNDYGIAYIKLMRILKLGGLYDRYIYNALNHTCSQQLTEKELDKRIDMMMRGRFYTEVLNSSFFWSKTKEGFDFWSHIHTILVPDRRHGFSYYAPRIKNIVRELEFNKFFNELLN